MICDRYDLDSQHKDSQPDTLDEGSTRMIKVQNPGNINAVCASRRMTVYSVDGPHLWGGSILERLNFCSSVLLSLTWIKIPFFAGLFYLFLSPSSSLSPSPSHTRLPFPLGGANPAAT